MRNPDSASAILGRRAEGSIDQLGRAIADEGLAGGTPRRAGEAAATRRRARRAGRERRPDGQATCDPPAATSKLWARLKQISTMRLKREELLMKLGAARSKAPAAWRLIDIDVPASGARFSYTLNRNKLRQVRRREGRYLLRTNLCGHDPAELWQFYIQLTEIEGAFKTLKDDLQLRPIYHRLEQRIEAHIFVAFLAYCLHVTLRARLRPLAGGLTPRAVLDKFAAIQML